MKIVNKEAKALDALSKLSQSIMEAGSVDEVFKKILDSAMKVMGVTKASIMCYDVKENVLKIIAAKGMPENVARNVRVKIGQGISGKVFKSEKPLLVRDIESRKDTGKNKRYKSTSLISAPVTCFPLKVSGHSVGVINMTDKKGAKAFTDSDLQLLTTIAAQAAAYLHIYNLLKDIREGERLRREVEMARDIQSALLPEKTPSLHGIDVAGSCVMSQRLGGDYYDILSNGWAPPSIVVADVSGHDIGAALIMSAFRSALRSEVGISVLPPSAVIRRMNHVLYVDLLKAGQFISMFYIQYINSTKTLRYASAGHPPAYLYKKKEKKVHELITEGPLIGIERGEHFFEKKCQLVSGDVLVLYTDGLIEVASRQGKRFGNKRLKKSILKHSKKTPKQILKGILDDVNSFVMGADIKDDITIVVMKVK